MDKISSIKAQINTHYGEMPSPTISYLICATPRSGTNLIGLTMKLMHYGFPLEGYKLDSNLKHGWGHDESDFFRYTRDMIAYQTSPKTGVFGLKLFWEQFIYLQDSLNHHPAISFKGVNAVEMLQILFNRPSYIFMRRRNKIKQAISIVKALQSNTFLVTSKAKIAQQDQEHKFVYDEAMIGYYMDKFTAEDLLWEHFFERQALSPYTIWYEDFVKDYTANMQALVAHLGLPAVDIPAPHSQKQANQTNELWYQRYLNDHPEISDPLDAVQILAAKTLTQKRPSILGRAKWGYLASMARKVVKNPKYYLKRIFN